VLPSAAVFPVLVSGGFLFVFGCIFLSLVTVRNGRRGGLAGAMPPPISLKKIIRLKNFSKKKIYIYIYIYIYKLKN